MDALASCSVTTTVTICHSRESGNPPKPVRSWIPAFAGMTARIGQFEVRIENIDI
jgi:hypothetical protein